MINQKLHDFASSHKFLCSPGLLSLALVITRAARNLDFPLDSVYFLTERSGQVKGLGKAAVQSILADYQIEKVLASEGGRTSRGSIGNMLEYVSFLNHLVAEEGPERVDLKSVESWWIERVKDFFNASPLKLDASTSVRMCVRSVFNEAQKRQSEARGFTIVGAVMQHLVGAKLTVLFPDSKIEHNGYSVADAPTNRAGDFEVGDFSIHVTTAPAMGLIEKCERNLNQGFAPLIISSREGAAMAESLATNRGLEKRIDILDVEQFLVTNLLKWSGFEEKARNTSVRDLVERYNEIVESCESDPSLRIELV